MIANALLSLAKKVAKVYNPKVCDEINSDKTSTICGDRHGRTIRSEGRNALSKSEMHLRELIGVITFYF